MTDVQKLRKQTRLLHEIVEHAYEHTVYYKKLFDGLGIRPADIQIAEDLAMLSVLTKRDVEAHYAALQADDIADCYEVSTGGTTGKPVHVMMERNTIWREWAFVYHYWSKFGYDYKTSKLATLRGVNLGKRQSQKNPLYNEIRLNLFTMNRDNIGQYVCAVEKYGAEFVYGYPSAVYNFCRLAREASIDLRGRFKAALLISENLYSFQEEEITGMLGCPNAVFYGHSERAVFAEKYDNGYIFQPLYGVTEIASDNTLIETGFINGKMPLIRYEVDDQIQPVNGERVSIIGHWNADILEGKNGEQISVAAINFYDNTFDGVEQYQFIQYESGNCVLNVVPIENTLDKEQTYIHTKKELPGLPVAYRQEAAT